MATNCYSLAPDNSLVLKNIFSSKEIVKTRKKMVFLTKDQSIIFDLLFTDIFIIANTKIIKKDIINK